MKTTDTDIGLIVAQINAQELISMTADLVRINSVWDPANGTSEQPVAEYVFRWAQKEGFGAVMEEVAPGRPNVIISWPAGPGARTLMFEGHMDVVTPGDPGGWTYDPFGAQIVDARMYGRGANDTKGNLAAMLIAMKALKNAGVALKGAVIGGVLCDEEGLMAGVQHFIAQGHADAVTGAVICEPQDGLVCISQKGAVRAAFTITGRMSHGAMPLAGLNGAPAVARIIEGLHELELEAVKSCGHDAYLGRPSFTPTVIQAPAVGPPQLNVMPRRTTVMVDVRTIFAQHHREIRNTLVALARKVASQTREHFRLYDKHLGIEREYDLRVAVEFISDRPCTRTDTQDPLVKAADAATKTVTNQKAVHAGVPGATDGTFLWTLKDIPIVTMGAGDREVPHQVDEWVDLGQLVEIAKIYAVTAFHYLTPGRGENP